MKYDLKYFILRTNALIIYREAIKFTYKIKDINVRSETQIYIRTEFDLNRGEENRKRIEYILGSSRKKLNDFKETYLMAN